MRNAWIGIDNGVTGTIGVVYDCDKSRLVHVPVRKELSYTKAKQMITRIDGKRLYAFLLNIVGECDRVKVILERPMINPGRWKASVSALRALEATLILVESLELPYQYIDSKEWQKELLPSGIKKEELKMASKQVGSRLFPDSRISMNSDWPDMDGLLIAEYARRKNL